VTLLNILNSESPCVSPKDINTKKHFFGAFGNTETEVSASYIVWLCQEKGDWSPFTLMQVEEIYNRAGYTGYTFNQLLTKQWIIEKNGMFYITSDFVMRCYTSSPEIETIHEKVR